MSGALKVTEVSDVGHDRYGRPYVWAEYLSPDWHVIGIRIELDPAKLYLDNHTENEAYIIEAVNGECLA